MQNQSEGNLPLCQGRLCKNFTINTLAVKVCHHRDCQSSNSGLPLVLCLDCDRATHAGNFKNHARFELKGNEGFDKMSSSKIAESDSGAEDDQEPVTPVYLEKIKSKNVTSRRKFMKLPTDSSKKKPRRHNTDDPGRDYIRLKVYIGETGDFNLEMIPALKAKTLKESLEPILEKYHITFESHSVFLDSSNTPLPLAFETFPLSGSILHVRDNSRVNVDKRVRDISKNFESKAQPEQPVSRTPSFGKRNQKEEKDGTVKEEEKESEDSAKKGKKSSGSTVEGEDRNQSTPSGGTGTIKEGGKGKPAGILTGLFTGNPSSLMKGKELPAVRTLPEILQYFTVHGLESEAKSAGTNEQEFFLEESWTKVVDDQEKLEKKEKDQQEAIWELLATEVAYINKLQVIKKVFILCLRNLQNEGYFLELDLRNLFSNIEEIYAVNVSFWLRSLKSVVNMARHTKKLLDSFYMADGFSMFDRQFEPYVKYCMEESSCLKFLKKKQAEDDQFKLYVEWCESRPECKRLKLSDLLVKPMQRVTKYPLLLKAILKKTVKEDKRTELISMIEIVEAFVSKVNASMKIRHEKEKLSRVAVKIEYSWAVDPVADEVEKCLMDNYCDFDLCRPMPGVYHEQHRCVLYEGALRLTEKQGRMDVYVFLFTDMLLLTKAKKLDKFKVVKVPMRIDKVKVHDLKDPGNFLLVYVNEYRTVVQAYVFQTSPDVKEKWAQMINKAKNLYQAVLQSDGTKCLTADDAGFQSPATTPNSSPTLSKKLNSWKASTESLEQSSRVPMVTISTSASSPRIHRHLSGSEGNLSVIGLSDHSNSAIIRRSSCNERRSKSKRDPQQRRPRSESKVMRSTSDPHNKPLREDGSNLSRSTSVPQSKKIPEKDLNLLTESSVDPDSPRSTTSLSEVDLTVGVDVDEIHMSLSPDNETPENAPAAELSKPKGSTSSVVPSESSRMVSENSQVSSEKLPTDVNRSTGKESSEKLKLLLAQKLSNAKKDCGKEDDTTNSHEVRKRANHSDRKRFPRSSSVERTKRSGEHRPPMMSGASFDSVTSPSEAKGADARKSKVARVPSSGSRQLPDPNQISVKNARTLPKAQSAVENNEERSTGKIQNLASEMNGGPSETKLDSSSGSQDLSDGLEFLRPQAPPIKAPLMSGLGLGRNNSNGTDRKRPSQLKRSPVLYRKANKEGVLRKSMDEQLLETKTSPPVRRAKSEADSSVETLRAKSRNSGRAHSRNSERTHSRKSDNDVDSEGTLSKSSENSHSRKGEKTHHSTSKDFRNSEETLFKNFEETLSNNCEGAHSKPEERERTRSRSRRSNDEVTSDSKNSHNSAQEGGQSGSTSHNLQEHGKTAEKPRRQIKKYRTRDSRKLSEADGKGSNHVVEPFMLESSEYV